VKFAVGDFTAGDGVYKEDVFPAALDNIRNHFADIHFAGHLVIDRHCIASGLG
jgi:hypothetical protein